MCGSFGPIFNDIKMTVITASILANYDGYLTTEKTERQTYDGTQPLVVYYGLIKLSSGVHMADLTTEVITCDTI